MSQKENDACRSYDPSKCPTVSEMLSRLGDKWSVLIIMMLREGPKRFSELKREVVGISQRMLTLTLRALERDGVVRRTVFTTVPPSVEYELTDLGQSFAEPIVALGTWVFRNHTLIQKARAEFDARQQDGRAGQKLVRIA
ncbi:winged helix-turn-helix transcriptional regulator [Rhizobium sp. C4]|uniref:winged helix-turn-helix transcriptional regulator n=1 Tax=Rhizobium sp. C4 TaxID=1349800 RepID=UPI001E2C43C4|nr:helix-turn-helix domain-containing protein [Rhizobium sp. C4]MCD2175861.1 helix-turn-helix transcriptional regulator [Rhizobium sp. C4]